MSMYKATNEYDTAIMLWKAEQATLEKDLKSKQKIEDRIMDLYRNNDFMRSLIEKQVDTTVGTKVTLQATPDYQALGVTMEEANAWAKKVENEFHNYADSVENWISADRSMTFTQMCRQAYRSFLFTGEITASREWRPSPLGYKTCFQVFSPSRIKTPQGNTSAVFGIDLDKYGGAKAYYIEQTEPKKNKENNGYNFGYQKKIKRVTKYNKFGWQQIFHIYEPMLPEYPRGIAQSACVLKKMKQLDRYLEADLDKAIITTNYVFAITSDEDVDSVVSMLSGTENVGDDRLALDDDSGYTPAEQALRDKTKQELFNERQVNTKTGSIMHLFSGEDIKTVAPPNTIKTSDDFAKGHARNIANGMGVNYELASGDFKGLSFSAGQLAMGIYDLSASIKRKLYAHKFATLVYRSWLDEAMSKGTIPLLGDKEYWQNRERYAKCIFTGTKRVYIDPVKSAKADKINLQNGTTSRTEIATNNGADMDTILQQRMQETIRTVETIEETAKKFDIEIDDESKAKIICDMVATENVETKEVSIESEESDD